MKRDTQEANYTQNAMTKRLTHASSCIYRRNNFPISPSSQINEINKITPPSNFLAQISIFSPSLIASTNTNISIGGVVYQQTQKPAYFRRTRKKAIAFRDYRKSGGSPSINLPVHSTGLRIKRYARANRGVATPDPN